MGMGMGTETPHKTKEPLSYKMVCNNTKHMVYVNGVGRRDFDSIKKRREIGNWNARGQRPEDRSNHKWITNRYRTNPISSETVTQLIAIDQTTSRRAPIWNSLNSATTPIVNIARNRDRENPNLHQQLISEQKRYKLYSNGIPMDQQPTKQRRSKNRTTISNRPKTCNIFPRIRIMPWFMISFSRRLRLNDSYKSMDHIMPSERQDRNEL